MAGLVRQEERAAARELALRRAGVELVAAGGREQVQRGRRLGGPGSRRRARRPSASCSCDGRRAQWSPPRPATRASGMLSTERLRLAPRRRPGRPSRSRSRDCPSDVRDAAAPSTTAAPCSFCRSRFATRRAACSSCARRLGMPRELVDSLESLASQVSLAVEGALLAEDLHRRQSEARFRSLVAHSSDLITVLDAARHRHLPEPVDRARPRLPRRRDRGNATSRGCSARPTGRGSRRSCRASARPTSAAARRPT